MSTRILFGQLRADEIRLIKKHRCRADGVLINIFGYSYFDYWRKWFLRSELRFGLSARIGAGEIIPTGTLRSVH
jgi:hypothetical protein